jgi:hypothetical protein
MSGNDCLCGIVGKGGPGLDSRYYKTVEQVALVFVRIIEKALE